jgi:hypothetical protein
MSVHVKNGTPLHGESLCETCLNGHIERGYRESEELVICQSTYPEHRVMFRVRDCSRYVERQRQALCDMQKIAWILDEQGHTRKVGFVPAKELEEQSGEVELILNEQN